MSATNWTAIETFEQLLAEANSGSPFWAGMLGMIFVVLFLLFLGKGLIIALLASSFLAFMLGMFLSYMGLVAWTWTLMCLGVMLATILYSILFGKE